MSVPKLRFPGFEEKWEQFLLSDVSDVRDGTHDSPKYVEKGYPLLTSKNLNKNGTLNYENVSYIKQEDFDKINQRSKVNDNDILFGMIGTIGNPVKVKEPNFAIKNVALIKESNLLSNDYLIHYLNSPDISRQFYNENKGGTQKFIALGNIRSLSIRKPRNLIEEQKIIDFLSKLNFKIQLQQEKIDLLKEQKKGFMQKIFSQELRFKDETGREFLEWQNHSLGTLGEFGTSYSYSRAFEGNGFIQHIHYGDIHSNLPTICEQVQFPSITEERNWEYVEEGDILFADASEDSKDLGKAILIKSLQSETTIAGLHTHKFTPNELVDPLYLIYVTQTKEYREFIKRMGTGVSVLGISKTNLAKFDVLLPSLDEQKKIGTFLFSFEKKIHALNNQKDYLIKQKQAFMQQMFI